MDKTTLFFLIDKYLNGTATAEEKAVLERYYDKLEKTGTSTLSPEEKVILKEEMYRNILQGISRSKVIPLYKRSIFKRIAVAASVFLVLSTGAYFYFNKGNGNEIAKTEQRYKNDIAPGGNKALLTLADGSTIVLDSAANGTLTQQGGTKIIKLDSGQLAYNATTTNGEILYNTISTPKGGQYQIVLADGSKVWLNAASSLRFPTSFTKDRNVELTGEGYFEVAHDASKPFNVSVNGMAVQVLGTHFNINAYDDEQIIKTTLLEGSVKVSRLLANSYQPTAILKPSQQAQFNESGDIKISNDADLDEVLAWKEGRFQFKRTDIKSIMRQLGRWYNVEIVYKNVPSTGFNAKIPRNTTVSNILKALELTGEVKFTIEGNVVTVMQ